MKGGLSNAGVTEWSPIQLKDCATVYNGRAYKQHELLSSGTPVIRIQNLNGRDTWYYSDLPLGPEKYCDVGDLLYAWSGTFGPYIWQGPRGIYHYHIWRLVLSDRADKRFLFYKLQQLTAAIKGEAHGLMLPHMTKQQMESWPVMLPPLDEQHRIVAKVDELMALCDELEAAQTNREARRDRLRTTSLRNLVAPEEPKGNARFFLRHSARMITRPEHVVGVRQAILDLAMRGRLVPQDPGEEPVENLVARIQNEKGKGKLHSASQAKPSIGSSSIPRSWRWVPFGDIVVNRDGERVPVSKEERSTLAKTYDYYGASGVIDRIDKYLFDKPLLLIGEDGANLVNRSTPIAFMARGRYWVNNHAHVLDGTTEEFLRYIELFVNAIDLKPFLTGTAQPKMNQAKMNGIPVALPPENEQRRIVSKVDELMAVCDELEQSLATEQTERARLLEALLHDALEDSLPERELEPLGAR